MLPRAYSNSFSIVAGAATQLTFITQPGYTGVGVNNLNQTVFDPINSYSAIPSFRTWPGIVVGFKDKFNNLVTQAIPGVTGLRNFGAVTMRNFNVLPG